VLELKRQPHVPEHVETFLAAVALRPPLNTSTRIVPVPLHEKRRRARGFNQALVLAESGNLLMVGTRVRDNGNWMKMSRAMVDAAALAATAAEKKDAMALEAATDAITVSCMECHRPYRDQGRQMGAPPK